MTDSNDDATMMLSSITLSQSSGCHHSTQNVPKIPTFNGESSKKLENNYQVWRHHVDLLLEADYSEPSLKYAVVSSLKGQAGDFVQTLPQDMMVCDIMQELNRFYGTMLTFDGLMNMLYAIKQEFKEPMTQYTIWLSSALKTIKRTFPHHYCRSALDNDQYEWFYEGLKPHIKQALRYLFKEGGNYAELFQEVHKIEAAHGEGAGSHGNAQKPALTAAKKYVFSKYRGMGDRVITKKTQMVHPWDEDKDELETEAVVEAANELEVGEQPEEENAPEGGALENMESTTDDISLMIAKALVTSLQQQKGIPDSAADKRKQAKCYKCGGIGHYAVECPSEEGA